MSDSTLPASNGKTMQRSSPSPAIMWLPGVALLCVGLWMVSDGAVGPGCALGAIGLGCLVVGSVAQGVAWGMDIHKERHP